MTGIAHHLLLGCAGALLYILIAVAAFALVAERPEPWKATAADYLADSIVVALSIGIVALCASTLIFMLAW